MRCITEHPGFHLTWLDVWVLETAYYAFRQQHGTDNHTGNKYVYFYFNYRGSIVRFSSAVTGFISVVRTLVKMVISLYSSGRATLFTGLHRGVEHEGIDLISHSPFALSVTVSTCVPLQKGFTTSVSLILEKNYSKRGKSKNLFILRCRSYPRLPLFCVKVEPSKSNIALYRCIFLLGAVQGFGHYIYFVCRGFRATGFVIVTQ